MPEPRVPGRDYRRCLGIAASAQQDGPDPAAIVQSCVVLFEDIPITPRLVLLRLARLLLEIEGNFKETKMDLRNLSLIFCQSLVANPATGDESTALLNVSLETRFVEVFFRAIASSIPE